MSALDSFRAASVAAIVALALASCTTTQGQQGTELPSPPPTNVAALPPAPLPDPFRPVNQSPADMYAARQDGEFAIPPVDPVHMKPAHIRQVVDYRTKEVPGTVVVDQNARHLYFIMPEGKAVRYAVGVGPVARAFNGGEAEIARKAAWPRWIPTQDMIARNPKQYERYRDGVDGGPGNPMGARALYMHKDGIDTYYRVHGTNDPSSIGKAVSAGCIRMLNQDVIDLYDRVEPGAKIVIR